MTDRLTQAVLLDTLHQERPHWTALLATLDAAQMAQRLPQSDWTVKDLIAHIAWYQQQAAEVLVPALRQTPPRDWLWDIPVYQRNHILAVEMHGYPGDEVCRIEAQAFAHLLHAAEALPVTPVFPQMPAGWQPWQFIAIHSYEHYQEHGASIRQALGERGPAMPGGAARAAGPAGGPMDAASQILADDRRWSGLGG